MTNMHAVNLTTVTDMHVNSAGAVVFWRLSGMVNLEDLTREWEAEGFSKDLLPGNPTPTVALKRAMEEAKDKDHIVRALPGGGLALVREYKADKDLAYDVVLRSTVDKLGRISCAVDSKYEPDNSYKALASDIENSYRFHLETLSTSDISTWLTTLMGYAQAVSLRDMGGIYFVPRFTLLTWERMVAVVRRVSSSVVSFIPAMPTSEALDAITEAITQEAANMIQAVEDDITKGDLGERALKTRQRLAQECESKISKYEDILGKRLVDIRANLETLGERVNQAILSAEAAEMLGDG